MTKDTNCIDVPEYINKYFFEKALENGFKESKIEIKDLTITMGSKPGENYCSFIYRTNILYNTPSKSNNRISLITKSMSVPGERELLKEAEAYEKETEIYFNVLPKLKVISNGVKFGPKCFYTVEEPFPSTVFEDLKALGYDLGDREKGLNEQHSRIVLNKLGKFHAYSMILAQKEPTIMDKFKDGFFSKAMLKSQFYKKVFPSNLEYLIKIVKTWPGYETIYKKLENIRTNFDERCLKVCEYKPNGIKVLNHGDLWVNNFMFKYADPRTQEQPIDALFVDYQISSYNSPGIDINYFLNTSVNLETLQNKRQELIEEYYNTFKLTLINGNYNQIPTLQDILNEIKDKEFYGFTTAIGIFPLIAMDRNSCKDNSIETFSDEDASNRKREIMFNSKRLRNSIKYIIKRFDDIKVLD